MTGNVFFGAAEYSVRENEPFVTVTLKRTGDISGAVTIEYATDPGTASEGLDYVRSAGTVVMPAGAKTISLVIPILDDGLTEGSERFSVSLISVDNGTVLFPRTANVSILDGDSPASDAPEPPLVSHYAVSTSDAVTGLTNPIAIAWLPGGGSTAFIAEKDGVIKVADTETGAQSVLLDIRSAVNSSGDRGLINIALHPDFASNHYLYAFYVVDPPGSEAASGGQAADGNGNRYARLVRYEVDMTGAVPHIVPGSETVLLGTGGQSYADISGNGALNFTKPEFSSLPASDIDPATGLFKHDYLKVDSQSHVGGGLAFGPDGMLYVSTGDGTSFSYADPRTTEVQDIGSLSGKVLRIDPITGDGLPDNPFAEAGNLDSNQSKVWQYGLRNPFAITFADDGRLLISETGWSSWEEINTGGAGANFGWPFFEGGEGGVLLRAPQYQDTPGAASFYAKVSAGQIVITPAFRAFSHVNGDPGFQLSAIVGASHVYTGDRYPATFANDYFFTDVVDGQIFSVDINDRMQIEFVTDIGDYGPVNFAEGPDGYLYLTDLINGRIIRLNIADVPNQAPVAVDDTWIVSTGTYVKIAGSHLAGNDTDGNSDPLTVVGVSPATGGTAGLLADGTVTFKTPTAGQAHFNYSVTDGYGGSDLGTVSVTAIATTAAADVLVLNTTASGASFVDGFAGDDSLTGGAGYDVLRGGDGNDKLDGRGGADEMSGGNGNDTMYVGTSGDVVVEWNAAGLGGIDTVVSSVDYTLAQNVENLTLVRQAAKANGNNLANTITGNDSANQIDGRAGDDKLAGGGGNDTLTGGSGKDLFQFGATSGEDRVTDFADGMDRLDFRGSGLQYSDLTIGVHGADATVEFSINEIVLAGLAGRITEADFAFV